MDTSDFIGKRGIRYYSQFKPREPVELDDGIFVVPAGWCYTTCGGAPSLRRCVSHFVGPDTWSDDELRARLRDWIPFDSLVMWTHGGVTFDDGDCIIQPIAYTVAKGERGDSEDLYNAVDYADVSRYLWHALTQPEGTPALGYADLYHRYRLLGREAKELVEWLISGPPSPKGLDSFYGAYWRILHLNIVVERIIGPPPTCKHPVQQCGVCGQTPPRHHAVPRRKWLGCQLRQRMENEALAERAVTIVEAAMRVRNPMSHGPHFDRSKRPLMYHRQQFEYDSARAAAEFKEDSNALFALHTDLEHLAHQLVIDEVFGIKTFSALAPLQVVQIGGRKNPGNAKPDS